MFDSCFITPYNDIEKREISMKLGIIGTNFVSDSFVESARFVADLELVAVCSIVKEDAEKFAEKHTIPQTFTDYKEMADKNIIDAVYVAVPNSLHHDISIYYLEKGIHVLCEKPFASNYKEVVNMFEIAEKNNVFIMEAIIPVQTPAFKAIKKNLHTLGTIRRAVLSFGKYSSRYDAYREGIIMNAFKNELSNGSMMDIGVYCLYDAIALFGKPSSILANAVMLESGVDGLGSAILVYPDKEVILMHSKITNMSPMIDIEGEDGTLVFEGISQPTNVVITDRNGKTYPITEKEEYPPMYYEIADFVNCIKEGNYHSEFASRQLTEDVHEVLTEIRMAMGLIYPADKK